MSFGVRFGKQCGERRVVVPVGWAVFAWASAMQGQQLAVAHAPAALVDAPSFVRGSLQAAQEPEAGGNASIRGSVLDLNGGLVPGATIKLIEDPSKVERTVTSDGDGLWHFGELPPGRYKVEISASGLKSMVSDEIVLKSGEQYELPHVDLMVAATDDVQVTVTEREIAAEQIKQEEKQRVLGVLPNFYSSYIWNAAPLSAPQKIGLATRSILDPTTFLIAAAAAGVQQERDTYPGYGTGAEGYGKRFGADVANAALGRMIGSALAPALFRQDPRYFYRGSGTVGSRTWYAVTRSVVARGDNGKWQPNYSRVLGNLAAGAISNLYHPGRDRGVRLTVDAALLNVGFNAFDNIIREFALRKLTPKVPSYATGKPEKTPE